MAQSSFLFWGEEAVIAKVVWGGGGVRGVRKGGMGPWF